MNALDEIKRVSTDRGSSACIHAEIGRDVERVKQLASPRATDAPYLVALIRAAVAYVQSLSPTSTENNFIYHGKRYPLIMTTLGRVKVCDQAWNVLGVSAYGMFD